MAQQTPTRRTFLRNGMAVACSAAASPLVTPVVLASAPWDQRFVVIILRGAMDGLDVVRPYGDPAFAAHRRSFGDIEADGAVDLDGFFALHPALAGLAPLWRTGELSFAHAVSTPYRNKRSHFDGQDVLENGAGAPDGRLTPGRDGWLNRMLSLYPGIETRTAFAVGRERLMLLSGDMPVANWSPGIDFDLSTEAWQALEILYARDPLFRTASATAHEFDGTKPIRTGRKSRGRAEILAAFAAEQLRGETRIAAFSISGWDTHRNQAAAIGRSLGGLSDAILTLKRDLGPVWNRTAVLCLTEFGRTVRENGNTGTDHGTGGAMVLAGGALNGARVHTVWPGLGEGDLFEDRDLMPTDDVRRYAAWALRSLYGVGAGDLERVVFPGLDLGDDLHIIA